MRISYINLKKQWHFEKRKLLKTIENTISNGIHVGGREIIEFEKNISKACKTKYCVALNSGTDSLTLALHMAGVKKGDEVITPPNSFIASTATIVHLGAKPIFVDVLPDQNIDPKKIANAITKKTKAIMPVHLTGRMAQMDKIMKIGKKYKIPVIEDAAQAIGSKLNNKFSGSWGIAGCFSAHPLKNLNALGDSGYLTTNNKNFYNKISSLRNHGMENRNIVKNFGHVSRMDTLQAAILNFRLKYLKKVIYQRRKNVNKYNSLLNKNHVFIPSEKKNEFNTYHTFVVQVKNRDKLKKYLYNLGIETAIHYPIPLHLQPASKFLGYKKGDFPVTEKQAKEILTLPINQYISSNQIEFICSSINKFYKN